MLYRMATLDSANGGEHVRLDEVGFGTNLTIVLEGHLHGLFDLTVIDLGGEHDLFKFK